MPKPYPILDSRTLPPAGKSGPLGLGGRKRSPGDLPPRVAGQAQVFLVDGRHIVDNGRLEPDDDTVVRATHVSVVDLTANRGVPVELNIPSADAKHFTGRLRRDVPVVRLHLALHEKTDLVDGGDLVVLREVEQPLVAVQVVDQHGGRVGLAVLDDLLRLHDRAPEGGPDGFAIDSWLITGMHGSSKGGHALWIRLPLAVLLGVVIAEPLLLKVFEPAVHRQVAENRMLERTSRESELKACNPVPYRELGQDERDRCKARDLLLTVPFDPGAKTGAITGLKEQRERMQGELDGDVEKLEELQKLARDECDGRSGPGLTGDVGDGPRCDEADADADSWEDENRLEERRREIGELGGEIDALIRERDEVEAEYAAAMNKAIEAKLPDPEGDIGLLEEHKALGTLSGESLLVLLGPWVLRLLLITVDCVPVLAKLMRGRTSYDENIALQEELGRDLFGLETELRRCSGELPRETAIAERKKARQARRAEQEAEQERTRVRQDEELNRRIDEYARRLRGES